MRSRDQRAVSFSGLSRDSVGCITGRDSPTPSARREQGRLSAGWLEGATLEGGAAAVEKTEGGHFTAPGGAAPTADCAVLLASVLRSEGCRSQDAVEHTQLAEVRRDSDAESEWHDEQSERRTRSVRSWQVRRLTAERARESACG